jgi:hypothetical protein
VNLTVPACAREAEALETVLGGGWPSCADADLRAHVESCPVCADVVLVAVAMRDEQVLACQQAQVPSAGLVWWRAERRARQEAARAAARPMTFVQVIAATCGVGALATIAGMVSPWVRSMLGGLIDLRGRLPVPEFDARTLTALVPDGVQLQGLVSQGGIGLLLALGAWLVLVPVALYVVFSRD